MTHALAERDEVLVAGFLAGALPPAGLREVARRVVSDDDFAALLYAHAELHDALRASQALAAGAEDGAATEREGEAEVEAESGVAPESEAPARAWPWAAIIGLALGAAATTYVVATAVRYRTARTRVEATATVPHVLLRAVEPQGEVAEPPRTFAWAREPAAVEYRLELYDASVRLLYRTITPDTSIVLPQAVYDDEGPIVAQWRVAAIDALGAERATTGLTTFHVRGTPPR